MDVTKSNSQAPFCKAGKQNNASIALRQVIDKLESFATQSLNQCLPSP